MSCEIWKALPDSLEIFARIHKQKEHEAQALSVAERADILLSKKQKKR